MITQKHKYHFLFLFFIISNSIFANDTTRHAIYILPIQVIGIFNSSIDLEYSIENNRNVNYSFDVGIIIPGDAWGSSPHGTGRTNGHGFKLGITPRFAFKEIKSRGYWGLSMFYTYHNYQSNRLIPDPNVNLVSELELATYDVQQQGISAYLTLGTYNSNPITPKLRIDGSVSIGLRITKVDHNSPIPIDELSSLYRLGTFIDTEEKGWHQFLGIRFNIKIGYVVFQKVK